MDQGRFKRSDAVERKALSATHGGSGVLDFADVVSANETKGRRIRFIHDDVIPPGASIGAHGHKDTEEYWYILSGSGVLTLNGERHEVGAGDVAGVWDGGTHSIENTGTVGLRLLVICASPCP